jgi:hypothetical protein
MLKRTCYLVFPEYKKLLETFYADPPYLEYWSVHLEEADGILSGNHLVHSAIHYPTSYGEAVSRVHCLGPRVSNNRKKHVSAYHHINLKIPIVVDSYSSAFRNGARQTQSLI